MSGNPLEAVNEPWLGYFCSSETCLAWMIDILATVYTVEQVILCSVCVCWMSGHTDCSVLGFGLYSGVFTIQYQEG